MANVISLAAIRSARSASQAAYAGGPLDVDFSDVTRMSLCAEDGAFIDDLNDPVSLGTRAAAQVRTVFWRHGLHQVPATYGELVGNLNYCRLVSMWLLRFGDDEPQDLRDAAYARHEARVPGRGQVLRLLASGDTQGAWRLHLQQGIFEANARDPLMTKREPQPTGAGTRAA